MFCLRSVRLENRISRSKKFNSAMQSLFWCAMHIFLEKSEKFFSFMDCENRNLNLHEKTFFENEKTLEKFFFSGVSSSDLPGKTTRT